jgi:hypothetical protein
VGAGQRGVADFGRSSWKPFTPTTHPHRIITDPTSGVSILRVKLPDRHNSTEQTSHRVHATSDRATTIHSVGYY